jgi:polysaccharide pyruvyl transferase WcaK-like protein
LNVLILHGYSDSNKGDLAIVVGMVQGITTIRPGVTIHLQSVYSESDPEFDFHHRFVRKMGVSVQQMAVPSPYVDSADSSRFRNVVAMRNLMFSACAEALVRMLPPLKSMFPRQVAALDTLRRSDIVLLKGGQYIYNDQRGLRALLYLWRILHPIYVAADMGKPVVMLGQSVGPLVDERGRRMTARALALCKRLVVREKKSQALMADLGLNATTELAPDFAFLINPTRPDGFRETAERIEAGRWLGITVVKWSFPDAADPRAKRAAYLDALTEIARRVHASHGLSMALFPQVTVQHHGESDLDLLKQLAQRLTDLKVPHVLVTDDLAPEELSYLYGRCQVLLGTRLHSCILAACAATPVVAIRYQGFKTEGIMAELGLGDAVFDIGSMDVDAIEAAIDRSHKYRARISTQIAERVAGFRRQLVEVLDRVLPK